MKGFSGDLKTRSLSTAYSPSSPESLELPEMKYPTLLGPIPEISFVDNLVFTFGSLRDSGDGDEIGNNGKTTLGRLLAPHVRVQHAQPGDCRLRSVVVFCFSRALQVLRSGTMSEGHDAPPTCSQANT